MVIARFSKSKVLGPLIGGYAGTAAIAYFTFLEFTSPTYVDRLRSGAPYLLYSIPIAAVAGIFLFLLLTALFWQIVVSNCEALWIDGNKIVYLSKYFIEVRRDDVRSINLGVYGRWNRAAIIITLQNGRDAVIPVGVLSEPAHVVASRLKSSLYMQVA